MQNTRQIQPGVFRTTTSGLQYRASSWAVPPGNWAIWSEDIPNVASWNEIVIDSVTFAQVLQSSQWYHITLEVNYDINRYVSFHLEGPGVDLLLNLSEYKIAEEIKFNEEAFWITLEDENLWNNCGAAGPQEYRVYYDNVKLYSK